MSKRKWDAESRKFLYVNLVSQCGPHHTWDDKNKHPNQPAVIEAVRTFVQQRSGKKTTTDAVKHQIRWAVNRQKKIPSDTMQQYIMNMAAALEHGFIRDKDLPSSAEVKYEK